MAGSQIKNKMLKSVYVVDDDEIYVFTAHKFLNKLFNVERVYVFSDALSAFNQLQEQAKSDKDTFPDLILLDLNMPVYDGRYFLEEVNKCQNLSNSANVIIVSSSSIEDDMNIVDEYTFIKGFISKPLDNGALQKIEDVLFEKNNYTPTY